MKILVKIKDNFILAFHLSPSVWSGLKFVCSAFYVQIRRKVGIKKEVFIKLKLRYLGRIFYFHLSDGSDLGVMKEIFLNNEYDLGIKKSPRIIFDLGSNVGLSVLYFKIKYPNSTIYAFEPSVESFEKLTKNTEQFKDIHLYNIALSDKNDEQDFYIYPNSSMSSSLVKRIDRQMVAKVKTKRLDSIMEGAGVIKIDFLKFDIEGYEYRVFRDFNNLLKVRYLVGEIHTDLAGESKEDFVKIIKNFETTIIEITPSRFLIKAKNKNLYSL